MTWEYKNIKMKKLNKIVLWCTVVIVTLSACKKSFLDKELIGVNAQSGSLSDPENARLLVNGCYAYINNGGWYIANFPRLLMESTSDDGWAGNDYQDRPAEVGVSDFSALLPSSSYVTFFYSSMHEGIRNCNNIINNLPEVTTIAPALKDRYVAECKFLRAYFYFELVKTYGADVLLTTYSSTDATILSPRSTPAEIYAQIIKDLKEASAVLPDKGSYATSDVGRATKTAALGLLAKAYLFSEDYVNAEATALSIVNSGKVSLESRFSKIFEPTNVNGPESIFEVNTVSIVGLGNGPLLGTITGAAVVDGGWGWFGLTSNLENAYVAEGDNVRRRATIMKVGEAVDNETPTRIFPAHLVAGKPAHTSFRYYRKNYIPLSQRVGSPWPSVNIKQRFAEILLIHAEAAAFNNKTGEALASLNTVRRRVGLADKVGLSGDALKNAIYNERRLELAGEGTYRWDDIRRIKIGGTKLINTLLGPNGSFVLYNTTQNTDPVETLPHREPLNKGSLFKPGVNDLWPIPTNALNNNSKLTQNPGY
jgi:starch-binding outer membrane protein, SusD/RagB family